MRENKSFEERLQELKDKYEAVSDFDLEKVLEIEDEYDLLTKSNPEHTKRRRELLDMRHRLLMSCRMKPQQENIKDTYVDIYRNEGKYKLSVAIYHNGRVTYVNGDSFSDIAHIIGKYQTLENNNIYLDKNGLGVGIADELDKLGIKYNKLYIDKITR